MQKEVAEMKMLSKRATPGSRRTGFYNHSLHIFWDGPEEMTKSNIRYHPAILQSFAFQHSPLKFPPAPLSQTTPPSICNATLIIALSFNSSFQHSFIWMRATLLFALLFISILPTLNYKSNARNALILLLYFHEPLVACTRFRVANQRGRMRTKWLGWFSSNVPTMVYLFSF